VSLLVSISTVLIIFSLLQVTTPYSRRPTYGLTQDFYYIGNQRWEQKRAEAVPVMIYTFLKALYRFYSRLKAPAIVRFQLFI
jgi:hypothetical protein